MRNKKVSSFFLTLVLTAIFPQSCLMAGEPQQIDETRSKDALTDSKQGWRKLEASSWRHIDARVMCGSDARLDPKNPGMLQAVPGQGVMLVVEKAMVGSLESKELFGDCKVRFDFLLAKGSNSGVKLHGHYEVQLFDSFGKVDALDGTDCGGIYGRWKIIDDKFTPLDKGVPPMVNSARRPGEWQTLEVFFRAPRFDDSGKKHQDAKFLLVRLNGVVVQKDVVLHHPTGDVGQTTESRYGPLLFQLDHGPVAFRNIRVWPLEGCGGNSHYDQTAAHTD